MQRVGEMRAEKVEICTYSCVFSLYLSSSFDIGNISVVFE